MKCWPWVMRHRLALVKVGLDAVAVGDVAQARQRLAQRHYAVLLTDMRLPDGTGPDLLRELAAAQRPKRAIVITAYGSADNAAEALKAGAFDYLTKPVSPARLRQAIATALDAAALPSGPAAASDPAAGTAPAGRRCAGRAGTPAAESQPGSPVNAASPPALLRLVGDSTLMQAVRLTIQRVARTMAPVHISGESGTGKELIARALHACSHRASGPFVAVNCGAIPAELLESELFGHRRGAFTSASADKPGLFQAAGGGTLFLDEVSELPLPMQVKLLRALQERAVRPVGATAEEAVDVRIVSATHKDLAQLVQAGPFRHDLYYRLNVIPIHAPALREHIEDLPAIASAILAHLARRDGLPHPPALTPAALQRLRSYPFPGNVRELENLLKRALALHPGPTLGADAFDLRTSATPPTGADALRAAASGPHIPADTGIRASAAPGGRSASSPHIPAETGISPDGSPWLAAVPHGPSHAPGNAPGRRRALAGALSSKRCCSATAGTSRAPRANWAGRWPSCATGCNAWGWGSWRSVALPAHNLLHPHQPNDHGSRGAIATTPRTPRVSGVPLATQRHGLWRSEPARLSSAS